MEYGENKICLKRQKNLFIILQDGWWGLDLHRKLNQQSLIFSNCNNNISYMFIIKFLVDLQNEY